MRLSLFLLAALLAASPASAGDLKAALEKAWARHPAALSDAGERAALDAQAQSARRLLPEAPTTSLLYRGDQLTEREGAREWEAELGLPLWLPGERGATAAVAEFEQRRYEQELARARLELAGELREAVWGLRIVQHRLGLAQERLALDRRLVADVRRRADAGELARTDLLLIEGEVLAAESELAEAEAEVAAAGAAYRRLTGEDTLPADPAEPVAAVGPLEAHPLLAAAGAEVELAQARARLAREARRDRPELALGFRHEREDAGADYGSSISLKLTLPLATDARNRPLIAAAEAEVDRSQAAYRALHYRLLAEIDARRAALAAAEKNLAATRQRAALAREQLTLQRRAFDLGELGLTDLLRIQSTALETVHALGRAEEILQRARARLNQAMGVLP